MRPHENHPKSHRVKQGTHSRSVEVHDLETKLGELSAVLKKTDDPKVLSLYQEFARRYKVVTGHEYEGGDYS